jgi:DNA-directed RNA polymerase III subunit RPC4
VVPADRSGRGQGRGQGRGDSSRGGRGAAPSERPPPQEMTASGPFAMGPLQAGSSAWHTAPRVSAASIAPRGPPLDPAALGAHLTKTGPPTLKKERAERRAHVDDNGDDDDDDDDAEEFSDPDEGVEIVDMKNVHAMDWMAPESLKWGVRQKTKKAARVKTEEEESTSSKGKGARSCGQALPEALIPSCHKLNRSSQKRKGYLLWVTQEMSTLPML